jgi:mannose-6-phosphate isomerase-like protein (cupin superfamily)
LSQERDDDGAFFQSQRRWIVNCVFPFKKCTIDFLITKTMIKYLKTPFRFDARQMQAEMNHLSGTYWKEHYNKAHYQGDWSILPLRAIGGDAGNICSIQSGAGMVYKDTELLGQCPYLRSVIDSFPCEKTAVRLMKLNAGALIKEHTDQDMHMEAGEARLHIPVQTNADVAFYIQDERIPMLEGECWYLNLSLPHRVHNAGSTDRVHLVIDCMVNDWVNSLLNDRSLHRADINGLPAQVTFGQEDMLRIITELRRLGTAEALQRAAAMEKELTDSTMV